MILIYIGIPAVPVKVLILAYPLQANVQRTERIRNTEKLENNKKRVLYCKYNVRYYSKKLFILIFPYFKTHEKFFLNYWF